MTLSQDHNVPTWPPDKVPRLTITDEPGLKTIVLEGCWNLRGLTLAPGLLRRLRRMTAAGNWAWDLRPVTALDSAGAYLLWRTFGGRLPEKLKATPLQLRAIEYWQQATIPLPPPPPKPSLSLLASRGIYSLYCWDRLSSIFFMC